MAFKDKKIYSILTFTCPRCHVGEYFESKGSYHKGFMRIRPHCAHCGEDYLREPGFYFGAAYVSYALTVALWVAVYVALWVLDAVGLLSFSFARDGAFLLIVGVVVLLICLPPIYRLSRIVWLNMFTGYRADAVEYNKQKASEGKMKRPAAGQGDSRH